MSLLGCNSCVRAAAVAALSAAVLDEPRWESPSGVFLVVDVEEEENTYKAKLSCNVYNTKSDDLSSDADDIETSAEGEDDSVDNPGTDVSGF